MALTNTKPYCELPIKGKLIFKNAIISNFDKSINLNILIDNQIVDTFRFELYSSNGISTSGVISFNRKGNYKLLLIPTDCSNARIEVENPELIIKPFKIDINSEIEDI